MNSENRSQAERTPGPKRPWRQREGLPALAGRLRELRERLGLSQTQVSESIPQRSGLPWYALFETEAKSDPSLESAVLLARALQCSVHDLTLPAGSPVGGPVRVQDTSHFPGRLRALRERAGLSQEELAGRLGLTKGNIYRLELPPQREDARLPRLRLARDLADALRVTVDDLLDPPD